MARGFRLLAALPAVAAWLAVAPPAPRPSDLPTPAGMPQILHIAITPAVVRGGTRVRAEVRTTTQVVTVTALAGGESLAVPRVGPGEFAGSTVVPSLPAFVRGVYAVTFRARDARGRMTQAAANVTVR